MASHNLPVDTLSDGLTEALYDLQSKRNAPLELGEG